MKGLIRRLLREAMVSKITDWKCDINHVGEHGNQLSTLICKDDENGNKFYLFVGFEDIGGNINYSYSFLLVDEHNTPITKDYIVNREEVAKYLPNEIKNKKLITPIIEMMTRKLLDKQLPDIIVRETAEPLQNDSLKRYDMITNIMVNEYGYNLIERSKNQFGGTKWVLSKQEITDNNKNMDETYIIEHEYTPQEIAQMTFGHIDLKTLKG